MTQSVYVIGGAGTGKSTFMEQLLGSLNCEMGPLMDLYKMPNARGSIVTLRGHELAHGWSSAGIYLGCMREFFPGTDGLDRASSITGEAWLNERGATLYSFIVAEGATLATRRFISALHHTTELLLIHLYVDDFVKELRFTERGSVQKSEFVLATATRSTNLLADMGKLGVQTSSFDSAEPAQWADALRAAQYHLEL